MAFTATTVVSKIENAIENPGNSLTMLTCKKLATNFARLQQRMP